MREDLKLSQLVCSRLCHDLVGAAGAVNAGLEILAEIGDLDDNALGLATKSGQELTRRLAFYRVAFGAGGAGGNGGEVAVLRKIAHDFLDDGNVDLDWPDLGDGPAELPALMAKLLLNLILIATDCLPQGGTVTVRVADVGGGPGLAVAAEGPGAGLREDLAAALSQGSTVATLDSRAIHGLVTQLLVLEAACELEVAADDDAVRFAAVSGA